MTRTIVQDYATFEDSKIVSEDDKSIVVKAIIASEIVQQYKDGYAYKPADELEKATWTADGRWVKALSHPTGPQINSISDIHGRMENPRFRKDLNDPKTNRPCRRGIEVDIRFFKDRVKPEVLLKIKNGELKDNSIGFTCDKDPVAGEFQGQHYDYVQRNICIDHLAAPIEKGRCPSPYCGINVDSADEQAFVTVQDADLGISYHFDKAKFTEEAAKVWVEKRKIKDCPVCSRMEEIGYVEAASRLYKHYGADILEIIEGHEIPLIPLITVSDAMTLVEIEAKITELHTQQDALRVKEKAFYVAQKVEPAPELEKIYRQMGDLDMEIRAFTELKAKKIVTGNNDSNSHDSKDDTAQLIGRVDSLVKELGVLFP